jgi:hypothetical protein
MKVFFVSAPRADKVIGSLLQNLYKEIANLGYTHTSNLIDMSSSDFEAKMQKKEAVNEFYKQMVDSIEKADICIFEATTSSSGVGYLIDRALSNSKPTIVLFYKEFKSYLLPGVDNEKLSIYSYDDSNYKKILSQALELAKNLRDKRFNFFISPQQLEYLEKASTELGMTKSQFIRTLLSNHKKKHAK